MKHCNNCGRITLGEPLFCNYCGRSYDLKLCPRLHPNPRAAQICSMCGSRELSTPQPRASFWLRFMSMFVHPFGFLLWIATVVFFFYFIYKMITNPAMQMQLMLVGLLFAGLWWLYLQLPGFIRRGIEKRFKKKDRH